MYGLPLLPEEAVMKLFQRALQYNDQKKLYMAALGIAERSGERKEMAAQMLKAMSKKFSTSAKVGLGGERRMKGGRGERKEMAAQLLKAMSKKFSTSAKVGLGEGGGGRHGVVG